MSERVFTVVGARPQFIKAAVVSRALVAASVPETIVHTGQHYDTLMSDVFFERLDIPAPGHHLGVGPAGHGVQTARILEGVERLLLAERPALVLVYGDTNSTLAGALAAAKLHIPVAHVESGLRSFNRRMPEEINRVLTDHMSSLLFSPTDTGIRNLASEGITTGVHRTGDVMYDAAVLFREQISDIAAAALRRFGVSTKEFALATIHRPENTDDADRWKAIVEGFRRVASEVAPILWPVHPRTRKLLDGEVIPGVRLIDPVPYFEMQALLRHARLVLTDSGGLQKEAAFQGTPIVTLRDETEWVELVECGVNRLAGTDPARILRAAADASWPDAGLAEGLYGDGHAARTVARETVRFLTEARQ